MPQYPLSSPKLLLLQSVPGAPPSEAEAPTQEATHANAVVVGRAAFERFQSGEATALVVMDDPARRGEMTVLPRKVSDGRPPQAIKAWSFENSVFAGYQRDKMETIRQCFDHDWGQSKLTNVVKSPHHQEMLCDRLRERYHPWIVAYHHYTFTGKLSKHAVGLDLIGFVEMLHHYSGLPRAPDGDINGIRRVIMMSCKAPSSSSSSRPGTRPGTRGQNATLTLWTPAFQIVDTDTIFIACTVLDKDRRRALLGQPEKGLSRFQFLESMVRIAVRRFQELGVCESPDTAMQQFVNALGMGNDLLEIRKSLHKQLFCEECDIVLKEHKAMLEAVFESYKSHFPHRGRNGFGLTYAAWCDLLQEAGAIDFGISHKLFGSAFALGKEIRIDEITTPRHMELSWSEFLVCLGATVMLHPEVSEESYADTLCDFLTDCVSRAHRARFRGSAQQSQEATTALVLELVSQIFLEGDDGGDGKLTMGEFNRAMSLPKFMSQMQDLGFIVEDFRTLFQRLDADDSGKITLDELCEGFIKLKLSMQGNDRAVAYFRKVFLEADMDGNGFLDVLEFSRLCNDPKIIKRLNALGIEIGEIEGMFEELDSEGLQKVSPEQMIAGFLKIRDHGLGESRGVNFLRVVFTEADADNSGSLEREEFSRAFCTERVSQRLQKLQLKVPEWMLIFDLLDLDESASISWAELSQGVTQLWKQAIADDVQSAVQRHVSSHASSRMSTAEMPLGASMASTLLPVGRRSQASSGDNFFPASEQSSRQTTAAGGARPVGASGPMAPSSLARSPPASREGGVRPRLASREGPRPHFSTASRPGTREGPKQQL